MAITRKSVLLSGRALVQRLVARNRLAKPSGPKLDATTSFVIETGDALVAYFSSMIVADAAAETVGWTLLVDGAPVSLTFIAYVENDAAFEGTGIAFAPAAPIENGQRVELRYDGSGSLRSTIDAGAVTGKVKAMFAAEKIQNYSTV